MTVPNFMSVAFSYQDLRKGGYYVPPRAWSGKNTLGQTGLRKTCFSSSYELLVLCNLFLIQFFVCHFRFVSSTISPLLLKKEFEKLDQSSKDFSNMAIKTRPRAREIIAVYTVDEISMELQLKLANNYPLSPVTVECGKRIGVSTELWRQWMLQLTKFLSFQVSLNARWSLSGQRAWNMNFVSYKSQQDVLL